MLHAVVLQKGDVEAATEDFQARLSLQLAAVQTRLAVRGLGPRVELEVGHMLDSPVELATQLLHRCGLYLCICSCVYLRIC